MTTHPHEEQLSAYMDGRLDVAQTHDAARHLSACASCRASLEGLQKTKALLRGLEAPAMPGPEFWTNAYRRLRVEGAPLKAPSPWETLRLGLRGTQHRWAAGLAVAALVAAAVVTPLVSQGPPPPPPVASDFVDVSSLVRAHTASAARQPLADPDRQTMIAADTDDYPDLGDAVGEASANATSADAAP